MTDERSAVIDKRAAGAELVAARAGLGRPDHLRAVSAVDEFADCGHTARVEPSVVPQPVILLGWRLVAPLISESQIRD